MFAFLAPLLELLFCAYIEMLYLCSYICIYLVFTHYFCSLPFAPFFVVFLFLRPSIPKAFPFGRVKVKDLSVVRINMKSKKTLLWNKKTFLPTTLKTTPTPLTSPSRPSNL